VRNLFKCMRDRLRSGENLVMVTVTASSGAVPRGAGARMLVGAQGRIFGTIGGGAVEYRAEQMAKRVLEEKTSYNHDFSLTRDDVEKLGMICGGAVRVFFHYISAGDEKMIAWAEEAEARCASGEDLWLVCDMAGGGTLALTDRSEKTWEKYLTRQPQRVQENGTDLYIEQICSAGKVYVFGGGHVAQELVPVLSHVGFRCVVMDDRVEFTQPELFAQAEKIICGDLSRIADYVSIGEEDYVCVMTRGHAYDTVVQAQVLRCHPCYCGVIGSRAKAAGIRKILKEEYALTEEELNQVTTPIGLSIQAETPAEIAISIAAQMILHRAERKAQK